MTVTPEVGSFPKIIGHLSEVSPIKRQVSLGLVTEAMTMAISAPIPIPLTARDEEEQLEFAIMRSLEENYSPFSSTQNLPTSNMSNDIPTATNTRPTTSTGRSTLNQYRRSKTVPNCASSHSRSPNEPTLIANPVRARSVDYSPPRPTYSTDCCEVKNAILDNNQEYLKNLNLKRKDVNPPLHTAVKKDHFNCLEQIVGSMQELVMSRGTKGETPLFLAATEGNLTAARRLIAAGADVNLGKFNKDTPLQAAIENDHKVMARLLLKSGADPNKPLNRGWTAVHECVYRGNSDILELVLNFEGNPNIRDVYGISPVFTSAACGRNECLDLLLRAGGDPNLCASSKAASPLYEACKETHVDCAITLLEQGADPHIANCDGLYPIHIACNKGSIELVEELLKVTDKSLVENCGMSPVHSAAKEDEIEILELLIEHGYDVNIKIKKDKIAYRDRRQTALFFAVYNDSEEATELLLKSGAMTELDYVKPLLVAESHGQYGIVDLLIKHGADVNASFAGEGTLFPATVAFAVKDPRMFRKLLLAGCDASRCFNCPMGEEDHFLYEENLQKKSFCHFLSQERTVDWAGWAVHRLLGFVTNVRLCSRMREILDDTDEWEEINDIVGNPRRLSHLCRLKIREVSGKYEFELRDLPLPRPILNFINHDVF